MLKQKTAKDENSVLEIDLRQPAVAALWAWLWPGAGHLYQGRYAKGILFMVCIVSTYFFGLTLGGGHVVYASFKKNDRRWQYVCQIGVGIPALPALVQADRVRRNKEPLFGGIMTPPRNVNPEMADELASWHEMYHSLFELGTLYTVIAGLLNVLAIYDAYAGPFLATPEESFSRPPPETKVKAGGVT